MDKKVYVISIGGNNNNQAKVVASLLKAGFIEVEAHELKPFSDVNDIDSLIYSAPSERAEPPFKHRFIKPHHIKKRRFKQ